MIEPLPNCFSICERARSRARCRSFMTMFPPGRHVVTLEPPPLYQTYVRFVKDPAASSRHYSPVGGEVSRYLNITFDRGAEGLPRDLAVDRPPRPQRALHHGERVHALAADDAALRAGEHAGQIRRPPSGAGAGHGQVRPERAVR